MEKLTDEVFRDIRTVLDRDTTRNGLTGPWASWAWQRLNDLWNEADRLRQTESRLREALEFYANEENWDDSTEVTEGGDDVTTAYIYGGTRRILNSNEHGWLRAASAISGKCDGQRWEICWHDGNWLPDRVVDDDPAPVAAEPLTYARNLAVSIHDKHYAHVRDWKPLPDLLGLLTQIDNMVAGLAPVAAEQERGR